MERLAVIRTIHTGELSPPMGKAGAGMPFLERDGGPPVHPRMSEPCIAVNFIIGIVPDHDLPIHDDR